MGALKRARLVGGTVRLAGPNALATKVLRITGLVKVFSIYPDVQVALASPFALPDGVQGGAREGGREGTHEEDPSSSGDLA